ncbi:MAG: shikimate dehydrogenase [Nocardioidaceae bacterium]|nr:shikimate dehydrogenase [Nocardioidaceae bacterium]
MLGSPIAHSLSPTLHRAAYAALGLDWVYDAHEVDQRGLPAFVAGMGPEWRGLSLTMPLKEAVIALCTTVSGPARAVGAVNTVLVGEDGDLAGSNTDIGGFHAAWREAGIASVHSAAVVGTGATARSAVAALADHGAGRLTVLARSPNGASRLESLARERGLDVDVVAMSDVTLLRPVDLVVSTIPGSAQAQSGLVEELVARAAAVSDVAYGPPDSPLVEVARLAGLPCAAGLDLLLHQAALQVELMTDRSPAPLEAMREAGLAELARRR